MCFCNSRIRTVVTNVTYARDTFEGNRSVLVDDVNDYLSFIIAAFPSQQQNTVSMVLPATAG
jgi:hypothetical protein